MKIRFEISVPQDVFSLCVDCFEVGELYTTAEIRGEMFAVVIPKGRYWVEFNPDNEGGEIDLEYDRDDYRDKLDDFNNPYRFYYTSNLFLPKEFENDPIGFLKSRGAQILRQE